MYSLHQRRKTMTDIFLVVALKVPWPFAVQNQEFPFYDNLYSLQKRKTRPLNFPCFSRDACGIKTKPFVPTTDTVDQRPNVSPLVIFAELTSTFFVHVLYWNIFQILLKGRRATERKRELKVWNEKITSHDIILVHHLARCIPYHVCCYSSSEPSINRSFNKRTAVFALVSCT